MAPFLSQANADVPISIGDSIFVGGKSQEVCGFLGLIWGVGSTVMLVLKVAGVQGVSCVHCRCSWTPT